MLFDRVDLHLEERLAMAVTLPAGAVLLAIFDDEDGRELADLGDECVRERGQRARIRGEAVLTEELERGLHIGDQRRL